MAGRFFVQLDGPGRGQIETEADDGLVLFVGRVEDAQHEAVLTFRRFQSGENQLAGLDLDERIAVLPQGLGAGGDGEKPELGVACDAWIEFAVQGELGLGRPDALRSWRGQAAGA